MNKVLTYEEAVEIFQEIREHTDRSDSDIAGIYDDFYKRAAVYANIRASWDMLSRQEKMDTDSRRTSAHDAFIVSVNIVARLQGSDGAKWRAKLGDERKRIGDFACFVALFLGLEAR
ncbi:MAG: hypothetical protein SO016_13095 [Lachnospiraceae bacterium]|nr:hypothetical protein [Robinsoniella sp.]MDY3767600.1 hypothetical protein [Lachnospiraceae bacterium]